MANLSTPEALFDEARKVLHIAAKYDTEKQYGQAVDNYIIGISLLMKYLDSMKSKPLEASKLEKQIDSYMKRAEDLKKLIKKPIVVESAHQRIVEEDSVGHSYENIFKGLLNEKITFVRIEEPYLEHIFQMFNLVRFCEMLVNHAPNLRRIFLTTKPSSNQSGIQELARSLSKRNIILAPVYADIHDREIRFDDYVIVKMGRGLDIYKKVDQFSLGACDFNMRPCRSCKIEIMRTAPATK
uniref:MIT domain-containing protein n=1 Tax=Panagrolaimus sp. ES5 TaxID=591445 RepID=A0AC34F0T3_9BILA